MAKPKVKPEHPAQVQPDAPVTEMPIVETASTANERIAKYFKAYPHADSLHETTDGQVFIDPQYAREHQKTIDANKEVIIYERP